MPQTIVLTERANTISIPENDAVNLGEAARILHLEESFVIYLVQTGSLQINPFGLEGRCFSRSICERFYGSDLLSNQIAQEVLRARLEPLGLWDLWEDQGNPQAN